jgi:hypothetical protein
MRRLMQEIRKERERRERRKNLRFLAGLILLETVVLVGMLRVELAGVQVQPAVINDPAPTQTATPRPLPTATGTATATAMVTVTPTLTPIPIGQKGNPVPEAEDDHNAYDGYEWNGEGWVPGLPTIGTQFLMMPTVSIGSAVFYAPDVMEANVEYRGLSMAGMVGAVAVPFCSEIGHTVWLQRPGHDWEGPYLVADCTRRNDLYGAIEFRDQAVEVDFDTAVKWGMARWGGKQNGGRWSTLTGRLDCVLLSFVPLEQFDGTIVDLSTWFLWHVQYAAVTENRWQVQNYKPPREGASLPSWLIDGQWIVFK